MDFKKNSAQKGALQKYEEFMSYARRTSPNSYQGRIVSDRCVESYTETEVDMKKVLKAVWEFCSYVFWPQRRPGSVHD